MGQNGHSNPQQWSEQSTDAYIGCHRQLEDQYRNPNMNNKYHLVGQLTSSYTDHNRPHLIYGMNNNLPWTCCFSISQCREQIVRVTVIWHPASVTLLHCYTLWQCYNNPTSWLAARSSLFDLCLSVFSLITLIRLSDWTLLV